MDVDFLSSIEVVIVDACESHLMQNWEHLSFVMSALNQMPKEIHSTTDISRIRLSYLDGKAKYLRYSHTICHFSTDEVDSPSCSQVWSMWTSMAYLSVNA